MSADTDPAPDKPDWAVQLQAAVQTFAEQLTHAGRIGCTMITWMSRS